VRLFPSRKAKDIPETKGTDVMPEFVWDQLENALALGSGPLNLEERRRPAGAARGHPPRQPRDRPRPARGLPRRRGRGPHEGARRLAAAPARQAPGRAAGDAVQLEGRHRRELPRPRQRLRAQAEAERRAANRPRVLELMPVSAAYVTPKRGDRRRHLRGQLDGGAQADRALDGRDDPDPELLDLARTGSRASRRSPPRA
jgi:hypothetical protein